MRSGPPRFLIGVLALTLATACRRAPPAVKIAEPADGASVPGPSVRVVLEATGVELAPASEQRRGTAHHHLFLDVDPTPAVDTIPAGVTGIIHLGRAQTEFTFDSVPRGRHRIIAVLADAWHVPLANGVTDTVFVTLGP